MTKIVHLCYLPIAILYFWSPRVFLGIEIVLTFTTLYRCFLRLHRDFPMERSMELRFIFMKKMSPLNSNSKCLLLTSFHHNTKFQWYLIKKKYLYFLVKRFQGRTSWRNRRIRCSAFLANLVIRDVAELFSSSQIEFPFIWLHLDPQFVHSSRSVHVSNRSSM